MTSLASFLYNISPINVTTDCCSWCYCSSLPDLTVGKTFPLIVQYIEGQLKKQNNNLSRIVLQSIPVLSSINSKCGITRSRFPSLKHVFLILRYCHALFSLCPLAIFPRKLRQSLKEARSQFLIWTMAARRGL